MLIYSLNREQEKEREREQQRVEKEKQRMEKEKQRQAQYIRQMRLMVERDQLEEAIRRL